MPVPAAHVVDFTTVSTEGLEPSPVAPALAGLRANEARYFRTKHGHAFATEPAGPGGPGAELAGWVASLLAAERDLVIASPALEATTFVVEGTSWTYVFYECGLSVNVLYGLEEGSKRAVGFKLSDGMEVPAELADRFRFARQRSKLAGTIRGSFFVIKGQHTPPRL
ncbi:phage tail protein [Streptomyces sp. NP160]|uniref:phage tail protein n=1 Tax=Streptomyces sp. NP160 TaxID=2586637 RepID=UPI001117BF44|nr:phage tail protein [Streptomyces sp. NP160]TNM67677.1 phage tail protein [Streptomyces sp. NP160]